MPGNEHSPAGFRVIPAARDRRNVYVHLNVPYARKSGRVLHLHIIQPSRDATFESPDHVFSERFACVAFVQGSAWSEQSLGSAMAFWCRFAERGYTIAIVEYRPSSVATFPAQVQDAKTAVRWLRAHADDYSVDPGRLVLAGDSSGGHTALMVHATQSLRVFDDEPGEPLDIAAFVDFYGPTDLARLNDGPTVMDHAGPESPEGRLFGGVALAEVPDLVRQANPATWLDQARRLAPLLMLHGSADPIIPFAQSALHFAALREVGQEADLVRVTDAGHGVWPAMFNEQVADLVDGFLSEHLSGG